MPNKTIYVSDDDLPLYQRAQELSGLNLSATIARALARYVETEEVHHAGYREVTVRVGPGRARRVQRFYGFLLGEYRQPTSERRIERFRVYRTRKGKFALHVSRMPDWTIWADPSTWLGDWHGGSDWAAAGSPGGTWLEGLTAMSWAPSEQTLQVLDTLEEVRDHVPSEFFDSLAVDADRPPVEDLDI